MPDSYPTPPPSFENVPEDILTGRAIALPALQALYRISNLTTNQCVDVCDALAAMKLSDDASEVPNIVARALGDADNDTVSSVLQLIVSVPPDDVVHLIAKLKNWVGANEKRQEVFTQDRLIQVATALPLLIADYPIIKLNEKALDVAQAIGNKYRGARILCDLRPVFDDARQQVEALVLLANLKLQYESQDGIDHMCEMSLTEDELLSIREEIDLALAKIERLKPLGAGLLAAQADEESEQ